MKPLAMPPLAERAVIDRLKALLPERGEDVTVGNTVPAAWKKGTKAHVQVALDGTPDATYPIRWKAQIRITGWHQDSEVAQDLAQLCQGLLISRGVPGASSVKFRTGLLPTKDPATGAQLASVGVFVNLKGVVQA